MNRRDFLKTTGTGLATLALTGPARAGNGETQDVMAEADTRIDAYRKAEVTLKLTDPQGVPLQTNTRVKIEQKRHQFLFGCNIFKLNRCKTEADNTAYAEHFSDLLNFATLPFYWWNYERKEGRPEDLRTDEVVQWCKAQGITTKGHPLAWNFVEPRWLDKNDPAAAMRRQQKRIARCVDRFAGDIDIWDVVNEATHHDRATCTKDAPTLTKAITDMGVGEYVRQAFALARQAGPDATLLINDYRTDASYEKKVLAELMDPKGKALYDVIGIQSHMHNNIWAAPKTWEVCERFARYQVPLHFTETTVVSGPKTDEGWVTTAEGEAKQAEAVTELYTLLFSHPAVEAITWWDFTDQNAWQGAPAGLIRADMTPKPAYHGLKGLIKDKWWTRIERVTQAQATVDFRGFLGDYQVSAQVNGRKLSTPFTLDKTTEPIVALQLEA